MSLTTTSTISCCSPECFDVLVLALPRFVLEYLPPVKRGSLVSSAADLYVQKERRVYLQAGIVPTATS